MAYAVLHSEKGKSSSGGIGHHIDRDEKAKHTFKHSDPDRRHLNRNFELNRYTNMPLSQAINERIKDGYNGKRKIRTDAVRYNTHVLTGSHEQMKALESSPDKFENWLNANLDFIKQEFGEENIVRFTLHMDEKTPHIHAVTVPLTADGRLSSREIMGGRSDFKKRQDRYAKAMQPFGLQRGIEATGVKHETARQFYARMKRANEVDTANLDVPKKFLGMTVGIDKDKTIEKLKQDVLAQKTAIEITRGNAEKAKQEKERNYKAMQAAAERATHERNKVFQVLNNPDKLEEWARLEANGLAVGKKDIFLMGFIGHKQIEKSSSQKIIIDRLNKAINQKRITYNEAKLLMKSDDFKEAVLKIDKERERRRDIDRNRDRGYSLDI